MKQLLLVSMLGLPEFVSVGLLFQNSFCSQMDSLLPKTSTVSFVLALMVRLILPKLVAWLAFHLKGSRLVSLPALLSKHARVKRPDFGLFFFVGHARGDWFL